MSAISKKYSSSLNHIMMDRGRLKASTQSSFTVCFSSSNKEVFAPCCPQFERGGKPGMSGRNIEVRLGVFDAEGLEIQDAVVAAAGNQILLLAS
jgi:hypothetical protein